MHEASPGPRYPALAHATVVADSHERSLHHHGTRISPRHTLLIGLPSSALQRCTCHDLPYMNDGSRAPLLSHARALTCICTHTFTTSPRTACFNGHEAQLHLHHTTHTRTLGRTRAHMHSTGTSNLSTHGSSACSTTPCFVDQFSP